MRKIAFFFPLFLCTLSSFSQSAEGEVFAPFVSRLEAEVKNGFIRLSWDDSPDIRGPVFIYRSESPLTGVSAAGLPRPVEIPYGAKSYIDEADKPGTIYYFVAASDEQDRKYILSIPFTNTITVQLGPGEVAEYYQESPIEAYQPASAVRSDIRTIGSLTARVEEDRVIISYTGDRGKNAVLYRSVRPIGSVEDLLSALIIQQSSSTQGAGSFTDYPVPGIPCYYALLYEDDVSAGNFSIQAGVNATSRPAMVPQGVSRVGLPAAPDRIRTIPLPRISLDGRGISPPGTELGPEASRAVSSIDLANSTSSANFSNSSPRTGKPMFPAAFPEDLEKTGSGEEYQLALIVQGSFGNQSWNKAVEELRRFLDLPRSGKGEHKARFYLGQCYYFTGKNREALFEFLAAQEQFPNEANPWLQAVLQRLAGKTE